jgi:hypothetical protein
MSHIAERYALPPGIDRLVDRGFLELSMEQPDEMTVYFRIPSMQSTDHRGRITAYCLTWIHPDHNAEFCHYFDEMPDDLPNFFAEVCKSEGPSDMIDDLDTVDDLEAWLDELRNVAILP